MRLKARPSLKSTPRVESDRAMSEKQHGTSLVIPYETLTAKPASKPAFASMSGWTIARTIHEKYGFVSKQMVLLDYKKIVGQSEADVLRYLGLPKGQDSDEYIFWRDF